MDNFNEAEIQSNETERVQREENRINNETERINSEAERVANEIQRMAREDIRQGFYDDFNDRLNDANSQLEHIATNHLSISVKDFGATGDGVTDDTQAIQNAINTANEGGVIYIPNGTYITNRLYLNNGQTLYGDGFKTILKLKEQYISTPSGFGGVINAWGDEENYLNDINIRNITIDGNKTEISTPNQEGMDNIDIECINFKCVKRCTVENVKVINSSDSGVDLDDCHECIISNIVGMNNGGYCVHVSEYSENISINSCFAYNCGHDHLRGGFDCYLNSNNTKYVNCHCKNCYIGFYIKGDNSQILNCSDENSLQNSIRLEASFSQINNYKSMDAQNNAISITQTSNKLNNITVSNCNSALRIEGHNNILSNILCTDNQYGFNVSGTGNVISNSIVRNSREISYNLTGSSNGCYNCKAEHSTLTSFNMIGKYSNVSNCYVIGTVDSSAVTITGENSKLVNSNIIQNAKSGVWLNNATDVAIIGNIISSNGKGVVINNSSGRFLNNISKDNTEFQLQDNGGGSKFLFNVGMSDN